MNMILTPPIGSGGVISSGNLWTPGTGVIIGAGGQAAIPGGDVSAFRQTPAFMAQTPVNIHGKPAWRLLAVFRSSGCEYKQMSPDGGCMMCGFDEHADRWITEVEKIAQFGSIIYFLEKGGFSQIDLLTLGNFFNDDEFSPRMRDHVMNRLSQLPSLERVVVESRREYVTEKKLAEAKRSLGRGKRLVYSLGYETRNQVLRNDVLRKGVDESDLLESIGMCASTGVDFSSFVLIKPPTLSEGAAIDDAVKTAIHVIDAAVAKAVDVHIAFEPVFVSKGTELDRLFRDGRYSTPWLWSIVQVLLGTSERLHMDNTRGMIFVGMSDEGLSGGRFASNCGECDAVVHGAIQLFNGMQDINVFRELACDCRGKWLGEFA